MHRLATRNSAGVFGTAVCRFGENGGENGRIGYWYTNGRFARGASLAGADLAKSGPATALWSETVRSESASSAQVSRREGWGRNWKVSALEDAALSVVCSLDGEAVNRALAGQQMRRSAVRLMGCSWIGWLAKRGLGDLAEERLGEQAIARLSE